MITTRYKKSIEPVYTDGRDIDASVGLLVGEAADQIASGATDKHLKGQAETWKGLPEPDNADPTYYDRAMLQEPVWEWAIPLYYYVGGLSGAALLVGAAAQVGKPDASRTLIKRCHWIGFLGSCVSGLLLVYDLGRPGRFLNMLRVFRPTSPMNMGAWILTGAGATSSGALLLWGRPGVLGRLGSATGYLSGLFGMGLATYTGVLVGNTAVPIWQESRKVLPALFGASALVSLGCFFDFFPEDSHERRITNVIGNLGRVAEVAATVAMEKQASVVPSVGRPLKRGITAVMWHTATVLTASSLVLSVLPKSTRRTRLASGVLGTLGSLLLRYTVNHAGTVSARDARASFHQQRAGHGAMEVTGARSKAS